MKKKIFLSVIAAVLLFTNISIASASTEQITDLESQNVYVIGTHAFTEEGPKLDLATIIFAGETIENCKSPDDIVVYFKQAGSNTWVDVAHDYEEVSEPEIVTEGKLEFINLKPVSVTTVDSEEELTKALDSSDINIITLGSDLTLSESITIEKGSTVTIDLNGKTITSSAAYAINNSGTLTLTGDGLIEAIADDDDEPNHVIYNTLTGNLTIKSGTYDAQVHASAVVYNEGGTTTIKGGTFTRSQEAGENQDSSGENSYYTIVNHGIMTINDGKFSNDGHFSSMLENGYYSYNDEYKSGINLDNPNLTINGGTFSGGVNTIKNDDNGTIYINGGSFVGYTNCVLMNWHEAYITGGTFDGAEYDNQAVIINSYSGKNDKGKLTISGGTFIVPPSSSTIITQSSSGESIGTVTIEKDKAVFMSADKVIGACVYDEASGTYIFTANSAEDIETVTE